MRISPLSITIALSFLAACSTAPKAPPPPAPAPAPAPQAAAPAPAPMPAHTDDAQALAAKLRQQIADLDGKSIYFDFDSFVVKPDYDATLHAQADFMKAHPGAKLTVQGNTDERGGSEYNLALGQKRAEAVRKSLGVLGVPADRIEATSFGKEKPRATCHEESCWSQNRRDDFVNTARL
ncbi:MAG TPA: peptidoglycan-associated lipoprotein Pal [Burkholderiaceae bacterium]